jgi:hypothetical protein
VTFSGSLKYSLGCLLSVFHEREREREREGEGREGTLVARTCLWCFIVFLSFLKSSSREGIVFVCSGVVCMCACVRACLCVTLLLLLQGRIRVAANGAQYGQ